MPKLLVDTDILIDFFRGNSKAKKFIKANFESITLSSITVAELYSGVREGDERSNLDDFIGLLPIIPVSCEIAVEGGLIKRDYFKSHGTGLADAIIAATSQDQNSILCSLNKKHFPMVKNFKTPYRR
jgi:predicted nucleic acid-binding protein